jgi:hypothetical protein
VVELSEKSIKVNTQIHFQSHSNPHSSTSLIATIVEKRKTGEFLAAKVVGYIIVIALD